MILQHYISGLSKPQEKRRQIHEAKRQYNKDYDKIKWNILEWQENWPWLADSDPSLIYMFYTEFGRDKMCV